jgi:hypothetical protein
VWAELSDDERIAVRCADLHLRRRFEQREHEPLVLVDGERCGIFWTVAYVQGLLRELRYRKSGEKFAAEVIEMVQRLGILEDTGRVMKPRRDDQELAAAEKFQPAGTEISAEGGQYAQPTLARSFWWRVFRVLPLQLILRQYRRLRTYDSGHVPDVPRYQRCLSALLKSQGLIRRRKRRSTPSPGSVQWAFAYSGPP